MAGFEPTTSRPPDEHSTGLSHIPSEIFLRMFVIFRLHQMACSYFSSTEMQALRLSKHPDS